MASQDIEPQLGAESFSCPHCDAVAHHHWFSLFVGGGGGASPPGSPLAGSPVTRNAEIDPPPRLR
jgi:hypothetical protein